MDRRCRCTVSRSKWWFCQDWMVLEGHLDRLLQSVVLRSQRIVAGICVMACWSCQNREEFHFDGDADEWHTFWKAFNTRIQIHSIILAFQKSVRLPRRRVLSVQIIQSVWCPTVLYHTKHRFHILHSLRRTHLSSMKVILKFFTHHVQAFWNQCFNTRAMATKRYAITIAVAPSKCNISSMSGARRPAYIQIARSTEAHQDADDTLFCYIL